jgi:hypothetical protein
MVHQLNLEPVQEVEITNQDKIKTIHNTTPRIDNCPPSPMHPPPINQVIPHCQPRVDQGRYSFCDWLWPFCTKCKAEDTTNQCFHSYMDHPTQSKLIGDPQDLLQLNHKLVQQMSQTHVVPAIPPPATCPRRAASAAPILQAMFVPPSRMACCPNEQCCSQSPPPPPTTPWETPRIQSPQRSHSARIAENSGPPTQTHCLPTCRAPAC